MSSTTKKTNAPAELPPDIQTLATLPYVGHDGPTLTVEEIAAAQSITEPDTPTRKPPGEVLQAAEAEEGISAWHNAVRVNALWVNASPRNAWASLTGLGWRRAVFANDSAFLNITALLSHARQMNASCNVRIEADNLIHEVYVW